MSQKTREQLKSTWVDGATMTESLFIDLFDSAKIILSDTGTTTPAGNTTEIQVNSGGSFTATNKFKYDFDNNALTVGIRTGSVGNYSNAFGSGTTASGAFSFAGGSSFSSLFPLLASGINSFNYSYTGDQTLLVTPINPSGSTGNYSAILGGYDNTASGNYSFIGGGVGNVTSGPNSAAFGNLNTASGAYASMAWGSKNTSSGWYSTASGYISTASGKYSFAGGSSSVASGDYSFAFGNSADAIGSNSISLGSGTASGSNSVCLIGGTASGTKSFNVGENTASGNYSFTIGANNIAGGNFSTASGYFSRTFGAGSYVGGSGVKIGQIEYYVISSGITSFNHSSVLNANVSGATGNYSVILGGFNNTVSHEGSVILGGSGLTSVAANTTYVENFEINKQSETSFIVKDVVDGARYKIYVSGGTLTATAI